MQFRYIKVSTSFIIANFITHPVSSRYPHDDPEYTNEIVLFNEIVQFAGFKSIFQYLPWYTFFTMPVIEVRSQLA